MFLREDVSFSRLAWIAALIGTFASSSGRWRGFAALCEASTS